jgi:hypothetical protein
VSTKLFCRLVAAIGGAFTLAFSVVVVPAFVHKPQIVDAFAAGFVNPFAAGYAMDTIACWFVLAVWVVYEAKASGVRHGWVALVLGVVPGVAVGLAAYLLIRFKHIGSQPVRHPEHRAPRAPRVPVSKSRR